MGCRVLWALVATASRSRPRRLDKVVVARLDRPLRRRDAPSPRSPRPSRTPLHAVPGDVRGDHAALISGAIVERVRMKAYLLFVALWSLLVYAPVAHWVWAPGGWLRNLGVLDFAGGTVVHINAAAAALVGDTPRQGAGSARRRSCAQRAVRDPRRRAALVGWLGFNAARPRRERPRLDRLPQHLLRARRGAGLGLAELFLHGRIRASASPPARRRMVAITPAPGS